MSDPKKSELKRDNDNPWYCLATMHGEQPAGDEGPELSQRNRTAWNQWIAGGPYSDEQRREFARKFAERTSLQLPSATENPDFSYTRFDRRVVFDHFEFPLPPDFRSAIFSSDVSFCAARFRAGAGVGFSLARIAGAANFRDARFSDKIDFGDAEFGGRTIFVDSRFEKRVPDFRGAKMHEATEWHGAIWPKPPRDRESAQNQVYAYGRIKQEMERLQNHEDELRFFRRELRARRSLEKPLSGARLVNFLYEALSDYGQNLKRPFLCMGLCFALGFFIFACAPVFRETHLTIGKAAILSFANIFSFLPIRREIMTSDMINDLSGWAQMIGSMQSLLGAVLLFFVGLALRNRFRVR